jgi:hypothetical protein
MTPKLKICIWCRKEKDETGFSKAAHIFPHALGGKTTCSDVCDDCNHYFGAKQTGRPSVEIALKEPLNVSRMYLMSQLRKEKSPLRYKGEYLKYDLKNQIVSPAFKYSTLKDFQNIFTTLFKRGIYKIFLEQRQVSIGDALDTKYDFIREFARYGLGELPVFYARPKMGAIFVSQDLYTPEIRFTEKSNQEMEMGFYSYNFMTHYLTLPTINHYKINFDNYLNYFLQTKGDYYSQLIPIKSMTDFDFIFSFMDH